MVLPKILMPKPTVSHVTTANSVILQDSSSLVASVRQVLSA